MSAMPLHHPDPQEKHHKYTMIELLYKTLNTLAQFVINRQRFDHSCNYCKILPICVRCSGQHVISEYDKKHSISKCVRWRPCFHTCPTRLWLNKRLECSPYPTFPILLKPSLPHHWVVFLLFQSASTISLSSRKLSLLPHWLLNCFPLLDSPNENHFYINS